MIGASEAGEDILIEAEAIGEGIARAGAFLICGGLGGVMEAACRGAKKANGFTIGILPGTDRSDANQYVDLAIVTGMSQARNIIIARSCDAAIAIAGRYGTLSEIAYCLMFGVPVIGLHTWKISSSLMPELKPIIYADSAEDALEKLTRILRD
ncbi:MAG: TIGR00725 family protein [candidate division WOR-3 bacterium]